MIELFFEELGKFVKSDGSLTVMGEELVQRIKGLMGAVTRADREHRLEMEGEEVATGQVERPANAPDLYCPLCESVFDYSLFVDDGRLCSTLTCRRCGVIYRVQRKIVKVGGQYMAVEALERQN